jgi:hypothetical protein
LPQTLLEHAAREQQMPCPRLSSPLAIITRGGDLLPGVCARARAVHAHVRKRAQMRGAFARRGHAPGAGRPSSAPLVAQPARGAGGAASASARACPAPHRNTAFDSYSIDSAELPAPAPPTSRGPRPAVTRLRSGARACAPRARTHPCSRPRTLAPALTEGELLTSDTAWLLASSECAVWESSGSTRGG